jgi:two-component system LytT family sensor kinase
MGGHHHNWRRFVDATGVAIGAMAALFALAVLGPAVVAWNARRHRDLGTPAERATFATLHTASLASPPLREGFTPTGAARSAKHLRALLGTPAIALTDAATTLAWDGAGDHHTPHAVGHAAQVLRTGRTAVLDAAHVACSDVECPIRSAVVSAVTSGDKVVGALIAYGPGPAGAGLVRATDEVAGWVSTQVELAELDRSRTRAIEAELRALRAQISPHFVYNSLAAIASFVRTDPERARELLLEFADFTRYAFRGGDFTTLAEELRNIERYLVLEQSRFGERLQVQLIVAPEVLPVAVPFLAIQPLVENAVRHGLASKTGIGHVTLGAEDAGAEALIWVEDDGVGTDPELVRRVLAGESEEDSVGLGNVDARLRQVFGDGYGLVVETAPGAGTKVSFRVPKFAPWLHAQ